MTYEDFEQLIAAYGADPARWPEDLAVAGQLYLRNNPKETRQIITSGAALDAALNEFSAPAPSDLLRKRILNAANPSPANDDAPTHRTGLLHWRSAAALMLGAFALGFSGANFMPAGEPEAVPVFAEAATDWGSAAEEMGLSDTYAWVEGSSTAVSLSDL